MVNLFTGIIFDGQSGSPMRLIQWNHTPTAVESSDRGSYLVSDYTRLGAGEKVVSWRYGWFEQWFIDYLLTVSKRSENWAQTQEKVLRKQLAEQHATRARLGEELARLVKIARTSDRPPEALLVEMRELEKQQSAALKSIACLEKRTDAIQAQVGSIEEERDLMAKLAHATDGRSRLRLRQLIRKRVARIDPFPRGDSRRTHADAPARGQRKPCFRIQFVDDLVSWVCCSNRNPSKDGASADYSTGK